MEEYLRSNPNFIVFRPTGNSPDTDNEHFLVFKSPVAGLLACWTQSSCENFGNNHIVLARSADGVTWSKPVTVVGADTQAGDQKQASWQFPVVTRSGRIYMFYLQEGEKADLDRASSGLMGCVYSDDDGHTWSRPAIIPMPRNKFDHPDASYPKNWIVWQIPIRDRNGKVFTGYTHWTSPYNHNNPPDGWYSRDSRCRFMRFENIDKNPAPADIQIEWFEDTDPKLEVAYPGRDDISVAQEPSLVLLPDGRMFCVMRTFTGYIYYSVSADDGATWTKAKVLREHDGGPEIKQPIASCPVYPLQDGRFFLLHHNNDGHLGEFGPGQALKNRRPAFIRLGEFRPEAEQPLWFSEALQILDSDGICIGPKQTCEIATYTSFTEFKGRRTLWYPDRKFFLLGKTITDKMLDGLSVPAGGAV
jgi:hypothetical protein